MSCILAKLCLIVGFGVSHTQPVGDGFWYQQAFDPNNALTTTAKRMGVEYSISDKTKLGLAYVDSGTQKTESDVVFDELYDPVHHRCLDVACAPQFHFKGSGSAKGLALTVERKFKNFQVGLGPFVYKPVWTESTHELTTPIIWYYYSKPSVHVGPAFSISYNFGPAQLRYDLYSTCFGNRCKSEWPNNVPGVWRTINNVTLNVRF